MPIDAGSLRSVVVIERPVDGVDAWGQPSVTWTTVCTTRADIRSQSGMGAIRSERIAADRETSELAYSIRIRWRAGITTSMRAREVSGGVTRTFDVKVVIEDLVGREYLDLVCATGASDG